MFIHHSQRVYLTTSYAISIGLYTVHREFISLPHMLYVQVYTQFTESLSHYLICYKYRFTNSSQRVYLTTSYAISIGLYSSQRVYLICYKHMFIHRSQRVYLTISYTVSIGLQTVHREFISLPDMLYVQVYTQFTESLSHYLICYQKQELPMASMFLSNRDEMMKTYQDLQQMFPVKCCFIWLQRN